MNMDWIKDLRKYFFSHRHQDLNIDAAIELKKQHIPDKLYKYRAINDYSLSNLQEDTVWCSNASDFNDPYDSALSFNLSKDFLDKMLVEAIPKHVNGSNGIYFDQTSLEEIANSENTMKSFIDLLASQTGTDITPDLKKKLCDFSEEITAKQIIEMNERFNGAIRNGYKICSFSERVDSILMWSHYSKHHTGFSVEYDFKCLPVSDVRSRCMWPVLYEEDLFDASAFMMEQKKAGSFNNLFGIIASIHKATDWKYEKEWRMVIPFGPSDPPLNYSVPAPKAIYLGSKISEKNKEKLVLIAEKKRISIYQMKLSHNQFKMVSEILKITEKQP